MATLNPMVGILLALSAALCAPTGGVAQTLDDQDCELDRRFDPPRMVCTPKPAFRMNRRGGGFGSVIPGFAPDAGYRGDAGGEPAGGAAPAPPTGGSGPPATRSLNLKPVRALILPGEWPPKGVAAYGVVAFPTMPLASDRQRFLNVCEAYKSALIAQATLHGVPLAQQMVTFWPVSKRSGAADHDAACAEMVDGYDLQAGLAAIGDADRNRENYASRRGPFLIA